MAKMTLSEELTWRGFVNQTTYKSITSLDGDPIKFYWGVDPSAPSMTIGNLAAAMMILHFITYGHQPVLLVGGATGMIGDPDGKSQERDLKTPEELQANKASIAGQYKQIFGNHSFDLVDNFDWFQDMTYLNFLREIGKHVPMRQMLGRDFVQKRLSDTGAGISYAEFSYVLIQAYDFLHLNRDKGVTLQVCGSDQWGNSVAGIDLIRRISGNEAHVWSTPLVINKTTGVKFGKSEDGAVWLDENLTSVFKFYQFWLNVDDEAVEDYLKIYTMLSQDEVNVLLAEFKERPSDRLAQKTLAYEVTKLVHGDSRTQAVKRASDVLFGKAAFADLSTDEVNVLRTELPVIGIKDNLIQALVESGMANSNSEASRLIAEGSISVNGQKILPENRDWFQPGTNLVKRGKNKFLIVDN